MKIEDASYNDVLAELTRRRITLAELARIAETSRQNARYALLGFACGITPPPGSASERVIRLAERIMNQPIKQPSTAQTSVSVGD